MLLALLLLNVLYAADCLAMPHLAHMAFGLVMLLLFSFATLCMVSQQPAQCAVTTCLAVEAAGGVLVVGPSAAGVGSTVVNAGRKP
jgi:hypothetical protein